MIPRHATVYLSGPMSGYPLFNHPAFFAMEGLLRKNFECDILNPARNPHGLTYDQYMDLAFEDIRKCDHILLLDGWHLSRGAKMEFNFAINHYKIILYQTHIDAYLSLQYTAIYGSLHSVGMSLPVDKARKA